MDKLEVNEFENPPCRIYRSSYKLKLELEVEYTRDTTFIETTDPIYSERPIDMLNDMNLSVREISSETDDPFNYFTRHYRELGKQVDIEERKAYVNRYLHKALEGVFWELFTESEYGVKLIDKDLAASVFDESATYHKHILSERRSRIINPNGGREPKDKIDINAKREALIQKCFQLFDQRGVEITQQDFANEIYSDFDQERKKKKMKPHSHKPQKLRRETGLKWDQLKQKYAEQKLNRS